MVLSAIKMTDHDIRIVQGNLSAKERQQMGSALIFAPLPFGDVAIGIVRIFIGAVINQGMCTCFQTDILERLIGHLRSNPEAGEGIALHDVAGKLVVLEETDAPHFQIELAGFARV